MHNKPFWACLPCKAWVGCHPGTKTALGTAAKADLRSLRKKAHQVFDPIWTTAPPGERREARSAAYKWLAEQIGVPEVHISQVTPTECRRIIMICEKRIRDLGPGLPVEDV